MFDKTRFGGKLSKLGGLTLGTTLKFSEVNWEQRSFKCPIFHNENKEDDDFYSELFAFDSPPKFGIQGDH